MKNINKIIFSIILILLITFAQATILVNTEVDKESLSTNEVGLLTIKLYNNMEDVSNYPIRIETTNNLVLTENEQNSLLKRIDVLKENISKEVKIKFKAINTEKETGEIFVYYGKELKFVSGTFVNTKQLPIIINTKSEKKISEDGEKIIIGFELFNYSKKPIYNIGIEATAPKNFIIENDQTILPMLLDGNKITKEIIVRPPLGIDGEQKVILSYGYFDENTPHYFEESFNYEFSKRDNTTLALIGIIVLIIAVLIYMNKNNTPKQEIKGTSEKAGEN